MTTEYSTYPELARDHLTHEQFICKQFICKLISSLSANVQNAVQTNTVWNAVQTNTVWNANSEPFCVISVGQLKLKWLHLPKGYEDYAICM